MSFNTAILEPTRKFSARLTFDTFTLLDDKIIEIKLDSRTMGEGFEIGTAFSDVVEIKLFNQSEVLLNKEFRLELGLLVAPVIEWRTMGYFTVESALVDREITTLTAIDRMYLLGGQYTTTLTFPATVLQVLQDVCTQAGVTLATTTFPNSTVSIPLLPSFIGYSRRNIVARVAEVAGGWAKFNRDGRLTILNAQDINDYVISKSNYVSLSNDEVSLLTIGKVKIQTGEEVAESGSGTEVLIKDNLLVQNPSSFITATYNALNGLSYEPLQVYWQGNFDLSVPRKLLIDGFDAYLFNREILYNGGLRETIVTPAQSTVAKEANVNSTVAIAIENNIAEIKVAKDKIGLVVSDIGDLGNRVTDAEAQISLTAEQFALTFTKTLHEMKNKLVYLDDIHMYGAEVGQNVGFTDISVSVPEVYFFSTNQGTNTYYFMPYNEVNLYGLKLNEPYTFTATLISEITPSTAQPATDVGVSVYYYTSASLPPVFLTGNNFKSIDEDTTTSLTFTLPMNAIGWFMKLEVIWSLSGPYTFMHFHMRNAQLEQGSVATEFSNNMSTISGAKYIFDGDNASFYRGGLRIFNNANTQVFGADSNGNLWADSLRIGTNPVWHAGNFNPGNYSPTVHTHSMSQITDYEQGTWTPVLYGKTSAGVGTYTTQTGRYTKIGNVVNIAISLTWTAHTGTGFMAIEGLPFTSGNLINVLEALPSNLTFSNQFKLVIAGNRTFIEIYTFSSNAGNGQITMDTTGTLHIAGHYFVD